MSKPRTYQTEAVIIKKVKLGEADRILTLYTPDLGKIRAVARGIRRPKSKLAGHLELLTHSLVSFARGHNLDVIIGSQTINSFLALKNDLNLTSCALYVAELVEQFSADDLENGPLFRLLVETLQRLEKASETGNSELALHYFEVRLLDSVGFRPQLYECVSCHSQLASVINSFSPVGGGMLCPDCQQSQPLVYAVSVNAQKVLRLLQTSDYATASRLRISRELSAEIERLLRMYIKYLLEREVKSTAWLDAVRREGV